MKSTPILTESMAPMVPSCNQAFWACLRSREVDDEAPRSKRMCASDGRVYGSSAIGKVEAEKWSQSGGEFDELDAFGPETPTKDDEVNKHCQELCSRDALWAWRAAEQGLVKAVEQENWRSNIKAAVTGSLKVTPLDSFTNLHFSGDVTIVDPFCIFFQGQSNSSKQAELRKIIQEFGHDDLILTYRGIQSAVLRTSCVVRDDDTAFEVFRNGQEVGANVTTSGVIAVVPKRLVVKLIEENGGVPEEVRGVTVTGIDGILRCSSDGDFIIRHSKLGSGSPVDSLWTGETDIADIVCSTGGSWTEDTDSDDEEEELTDEEMAEAVAEVAKLTNSYTNPHQFHCNGQGLIHKFTNFEVSMLS